MVCFKCGNESRVLFSEKENNRVYRQRKCLGCGRKWFTEEIENCDQRVATAINRIRCERYGEWRKQYNSKRRKKGE